MVNNPNDNYVKNLLHNYINNAYPEVQFNEEDECECLHIALFHCLPLTLVQPVGKSACLLCSCTQFNLSLASFTDNIRRSEEES